jgi:hypothetical protein
VLVVGLTVAVVLDVVGVVPCVVEVLELPGVVVCVVMLVVEPSGSVTGVLVLEVLLVALVLLVTRVLLVTLVLVTPVPGGRLVVVVLVTTIGAGHAVGAGAFRATKRPGRSFPIFPPKRRQ